MNTVEDNETRKKLLIDNYRMTGKDAQDRINKYNENERNQADGNILVTIEQNEGKIQATVKNVTSSQ